MISTAMLNGWAGTWAAFMLRGVVESSILLAAIGLPWLALRRRISPQLSYGLFLLVVLDLALPIPVNAPAWLARLSPRHTAERLVGWATAEPPPAPAGPRSDPFAPAPPPPGLASAPARPRTEARTPTDDIAPTAVSAVPAPSEPPGPEAVDAPAPRAMVQVARLGRDDAAGPGLTPSAVLMLAWAAVVLGLLARLAWVHVRMHRQLRAAVPLDPARLPVDLNHLRRLVGLRRAVPVLETVAVAAPAVWVWTRPRLLLPPGLAAELPPSQLSWALLHELVHIRRGDIWVATFQRLVQAVYFFHPAAWLANRAIDVQREYACDDAALALSGLSRRDCGAGLLTIVGRAHGLPMPKAPALALFRSEASIRRRLLRLLDTRRRLHRRLSLGAAMLLAAVGLIVLPNVRARQDGREGQGGAGAKTKATDRPIVGEVVDADGKPAAGADVWLAGTIVPEGKAILLGHTRTDTEGRFSLQSPGPEAMSGMVGPGIWAYRRGSGAAWTKREPDGTVSLEGRSNRLTLGGSTPVRVRILESDGAPLPGTRVGVRHLQDAASYVPDELIGLTAAETDADGRSTLTAFTPAEILGILVTSPRFGRQVAMFRQGVDGEATIRLRPAARAEGRVVADDPAAVRGLAIWVHSRRAEPNGPEVYAHAEATTDDRGRFEFPAIAAGDLSVSVLTRKSSPYFAPGSVDASVGPGGLARVEVRLAKAVRVRGEVREKGTGHPIAGVKLRYFGPGGSDLPMVETDANGRYQALALPGQGSRWVIPPKSYLAPKPGGSTPITIGPEAEQALPPIELERGASLRGVVVGDDGKPVAGAKVEGKWMVVEPLSGRGGPTGIGHNFTASATTDDRGAFLLEGIHPTANVTLEASAAEARTEQPRNATPAVDESVTLRISGANTVALAGRVVDSSGAPIAGVSVQIRARPPDRDGFAEQEPVQFGDSSTIRPGADGRFRTPRQLRRGYAYRAEAQAGDFMADITPWLSLGADTVPTLPDLTMRRVRTVAGRVLDRSGRAVPDATVRQSGDGPKPTRALTDAQGRFALPGVLEGRFFLFVDKPGYRPAWRLAGPLGADIELTIARDDEPGPEPRRYRPPTLPRPEELALLHRLFDAYADGVLKQGGPEVKSWFLPVLVRIDPDRALELINAGGDVRSRDLERREFALHRLAAAPDEAGQLVESIEDPDLRAWSEVSVAAALPAAERARKLDLLTHALVNARAVSEPADRALKFANIGEGLLDLGEVERATSVLREGQALAGKLPKAGWAGFARRTVAEELAPIDLAGALTLLEGMQDDREYEMALGHIAHELAARAPAEAERVLGMMRDQWPHFRDDYAQRVCYRMAAVDPKRARAIAGRMKDYRAKARALGAMALALKADRTVAAGLVREAFAVLERAVEEGQDMWNGLGSASTAAAGLLPIVEQVDPRLVSEALGRTLALRPPLRGSDTRDAIAALSDAQVAAAVARYDHVAARAVLDACTGDLLNQILGATDRDRSFYLDLLFDAATFVDPDRAAELLDRLPEPADPSMSLPRNNARLRIARVLADSGEERWAFIESRLLHVWRVDTEDY
jgi:beta-lactamase regulating signal transducer with metallopeptidase domain/protocatechuate 3,4-dioxygenase beta subunit